MKNITVKVDEDTYRRARTHAAENGTSVSALVREFLETQLLDDAAHTGRIRDLEALYKVANKRAKSRKKPLKPLTRAEIYDERLR